MFDSSADLIERIELGEDSQLELKEVVFSGEVVKGPSRADLADEIAAFANTRGGILVLGVSDKAKDILGIPLPKLDAVEEYVTRICIDSIEPPVAATTERLKLPDSSGQLQAVLRVNVERSLSVHRSPAGYVMRVGSSKRNMHPEQLARLFQHRSQTRLVRFDELPVPGTSFAEFNCTLIDRFRTDRTSDDRKTLAIKLGMAVTDEFERARLTVAGVLLGTSTPEMWIPNAFIQAVAYRGRSIGEALDTRNYQIDARDITGPIDVQVSEACQFVTRNQRIAASKRAGRVDVPQYDITAVFEAVVNAVAHRDYSMEQSKIRLRMFSDRLELYIPGELANTMTPETLAYRQATRNETIASLLAKCEVPSGIANLRTTRSTLMDRRGEGVPLILSRSEKLAGRIPKYETINATELRLTIFGR